MFSYEEAIEFITSKDNFYIDLGLERISKVLEMFGNPQESLKIIHVAGTNGKGSVCAMLESILREAGYKTGLYTSPHIWEYTERIQICGRQIPKEDFAYYVDKISNCKIHLTEFEILTVIMFLYFKEQGIDVAVIETGLGGRLDATNVIKKNLCSIITHIDLDHTDRLGDTKDKIAYEKAGIIKPDCPVITSMGYEVIKDRADELNSLLIFVSPFVQQEFTDALSLKGQHQIENLALAITAIQHLFPEISNKTIIEGLKKVKHPCRFEYIKDKNLIIDASHNPNGIQALRDNLDTYFPNPSRRFVFGCLKTKDYKKMMEILFRPEDEIYLNEFDYPNACTYKELAESCPYEAKKYCNSYLPPTDKLNIICGSFYMISQMRFIAIN
jgi:dihydrofolate synthase/folylpolyglutamate synthase